MGRPKLLEVQRAELYQRYTSPGPNGRPTYKELGEIYGISPNAVWHIIHRKGRTEVATDQKEARGDKKRKERTLKVSKDKWPEIVRRIEEDGADPKDLAAEFGVSASLIHRIDLKYRESLEVLPDDSVGDDPDANVSEEQPSAAVLIKIGELTTDQREELIEVYQSTDQSYSEIARTYNISPTGVWHVINQDLGPEAMFFRRIREEVVKDGLLRTIGQLTERISRNVKGIKPGAAAIPLGILVDKYQILSGGVTSRSGTEFAPSKEGASSSAREKAAVILAEAIDIVGESGADSSGAGEEGPERVPPLLLQGPSDGRAGETAVVPPEVAKDDGAGGAAADHSAEEPRQDDPGGGPDNMGAGEQSESPHKDSLPVRQQSG